MVSIQVKKDKSTYLPGQTISGMVSWGELPPETDKVAVRLIWFTSGKGDRDVQIVGELDVDRPGAAGELEFNFVVPHRPYSFSGQLISLTWALEAIVFPGMEAQQLELIVSPNAREILLDHESSPLR